jgi:hypothetical protein
MTLTPGTRLGPGGKWRISSGGSRQGGWLGGGKEICYTDHEGKVFAVPVTDSGAGLRIGSRRPLFGGQDLPAVLGAFTRDGERYLGATPVAGDTGAVLTLVTNRAAELEKR